MPASNRMMQRTFLAADSDIPSRNGQESLERTVKWLQCVYPDVEISTEMLPVLRLQRQENPGELGNISFK